MEKKVWKYGEYCNEPAKEGETRILRNPNQINKPISSNIKEFVKGKTLPEVFDNTRKKYPNRKYIGCRKRISQTEYGDFEFKTFEEVGRESDYLASALAKLNFIPKKYVKEHDKYFKIMGCLSHNREEWVICDLACLRNSITMANAVDIQMLIFIASQTQFEALFLEEDNIENILNLKKNGEFQSLKNIVTFSSFNFDKELRQQLVGEAEKVNIKIYSYNELLAIGKEYFDEKQGKVDYDLPNEDTYCIFCYTSGTTGGAKGAMISHKNFIANFDTLLTHGPVFTVDDVYISYLPLAHIYDQKYLKYSYFFANTIGYCTETINLLKDCQTLHPTIIPGVPRIYERINNYIDEFVDSFDDFRKKLFREAFKVKCYYHDKFGFIRHWLFDYLIFDRIKEKLGGRIRWISVGSAPSRKELLKKLRLVLCSVLTEGYGMSETAGTVTLCNEKDTALATVGGPHGSCELKLVDVPSLGYSSKDICEETGSIVPRGELCIRGPIVFDGYFKCPEKNKELIDEDGWFHTGDVCLFNTDFGNSMRIIDRVKNIFKLSQGEFVMPDQIQTILKNSKYVDQIFVTGRSDQRFLIGIVVPNKNACAQFLKDNGVTDLSDSSIYEEYEKEKLNKEIESDLQKIGRNAGLKGYELTKKVYLTKESFNEQNRLATSTGKLKTNELKKYFKDQIDKMYT